MAIQLLTLYTGDVPLIGQTQIVFDTNTGNILTYLNSFGTDLNARTAEMNTSISTVNTLNTNVNNKHLDVVNKTVEATTARDEAVSAKNQIQDYVVPTDAVDSQTVRNAKDKLINKANFIANGHTAEPKEYIETNTSYTMIDQSTDSLIVNGNVVEQSTQNIVLPLAPFDQVSTDEVLDDSVNGLNTQMAHNKGDIVVTGNELVTNGTFDTDTSGWTASGGAVLSVVSNEMKIQGGTTDYPKAEQVLTGLLPNTDYILSLDITVASIETNYGIRDVVGASWLVLSDIGVSAGTYAHSFTTGSDVSNVRLDLYAGNITNALDSTFDNISVTLKDDVYQASEYTVDMYDVYVDDTSITDVLGGEVLFASVSGTHGTSPMIINHFYIRIDGADTADVTKATSMNSSFWIDLGTASTMSLQNPYFKVLPRVARQDVVVHRVNKSTLAYDKYSFKGTKLFEDTADSIEIMNYYFGSADERGLWSDATYYYLPLDIFERLS